MFQPVHDVIDPLPEMRKREILGPDPRDVVEMFLGDMRERSLEIGEVFFGETNDPVTCVGEFVGPDTGSVRISVTADAPPGNAWMRWPRRWAVPS
jgi:hypothetical protein